LILELQGCWFDPGSYPDAYEDFGECQQKDVSFLLAYASLGGFAASSLGISVFAESLPIWKNQ
jgi:hypothetical protein